MPSWSSSRASTSMRATATAVLAAVAVARIDVDARELDQLGMAAECLAQAYDSRHADGHGGRTDLGTVLLDDLDLVEGDDRPRALPGNDLDRLVALAEQERTRGVYVHHSTSPCLSGTYRCASAGSLTPPARDLRARYRREDSNLHYVALETIDSSVGLRRHEQDR